MNIPTAALLRAPERMKMRMTRLLCSKSRLSPRTAPEPTLVFVFDDRKENVIMLRHILGTC